MTTASSPSRRISPSRTGRRKWRSRSTMLSRARGSATLLLERLAAHAVQNGFHRFHATTSADNGRCSRYSATPASRFDPSPTTGCIDLQWSLTPSAEGVASAERRRRLATVRSMRPMLAPRAVAVDRRVERSAQDRRPHPSGDARAAGLPGQLYAVHPTAAEIQGVPVCRSARDLPPGVDLAIIAVPPAAVLGSRRRLRGRRRQGARRHHRRVRRSRPRRARRCRTRSSRRFAATACAWSGPTAWGCSTSIRTCG